MPNQYEKKRHLNVTPEPPFKVNKEEAAEPIFVVQKHAARRLHYDLRLEVDGVLKSWAVPAGPSLDPAVKRLAVMVEDHPKDYASFEGVIPEGEYGAGKVIVWDNGNYSPDDEGILHFDDPNKAQDLMRKGLEKGKLSFVLRGEKLKGSWTLVKMKNGENNWLFFKHKDAYANPSRDILENDRSVISGLPVDKAESVARPDPVKENSEYSGKRSLFPGSISPMLAGSTTKPFSGPEWYFEPKLDGYRIIGSLNNGEVRLFSRNGHDLTENYAEIAVSLKKLPAEQLIVDGELIALDEKGKSCFQCLQGFLEKKGTANPRFKAAALVYYIFDVLFLDGRSLLDVPLEKRKGILDRVVVPSSEIRILDRFEGEGKAIFKGAVEAGLEGIVAKRKDSTYRPGERSDDWLKIKATKTDEFVIGGFTKGTGNRESTFGALILGAFDEEGRLISAGQVGTGFDEPLLNNLKKRLDAIKTKKSPFADKPELTSLPTWVRPAIVAEIKFSERTRDGKLRAPVFLRLRDDKPAAQVKLGDGSPDAMVKGTHSSPLEQDSGDVSNVLKQLESPREALILEIGTDRLELTNLSKKLWPGVTKRELLIYLAKVSGVFLLHLKDRPLSLSRYPNGISGEHFYQKHWEHPKPKFVATVPLSEQSKNSREYMMCNNLQTLLWLGQIADLELHTWFSRINEEPDIKVPRTKEKRNDRIDYLSQYPDFIIFDMDPYVYSGKEPKGDEPELSRKGFTQTCEVALRLKEILDGLSLASFVKTTGKTGLHVYVPIVRQFDFAAARFAAKTVSVYLENRFPKLVTTDWAVEKRTGKIFLDYNQNVRGKTLASVYSPRPSKEAAVSTPVRWDELEEVYPNDFTIRTIPERLAKTGDLWENILKSKHDLKELLKLD